MTDLDRIVALDDGGDATPLFCVHASSGSAFSYLGLAQQLGDRPVYGIEASGFDGDGEPARSLPALSSGYAETLRAFHPDGEYLLLGWSLGGIIALDMARRLTKAGAHVPLVIMIDVSVPVIAELPPEKEIVRRFLLDILATLGVPTAVLGEMLADQPDDASSGTLFEAVERSGALPSELDAELLGMRYAIFRALIEASYGFEVTEPYDGPVVHLIATESQSEQMRWARIATNLTEHMIDGNHHSIWSLSALPDLAKLVDEALASRPAC